MIISNMNNYNNGKNSQVDRGPIWFYALSHFVVSNFVLPKALKFLIGTLGFGELFIGLHGQFISLGLIYSTSLIAALTLRPRIIPQIDAQSTQLINATTFSTVCFAVFIMLPLIYLNFTNLGGLALFFYIPLTMLNIFAYYKAAIYGLNK
jgi:hypothetical protein